MFKVTEKAKEKLQQILQSKTDNPEACLRISLAPEGKHLTLSIDRQQSSDHIIKDKKDNNILLINSDLVSSLEDQVFDFQEGQEGGGFTVSPLAPGDVEKKLE